MPLDSLTYSPVALDADGEILMRAAEYIEKHGLCKFAQQRGGKVCMFGAISMVVHGSPYGDDGEVPRLAKRLGFAKPWDGADWNNERQRTAPDVISRLRAAAQGVGR